MYLSSGPYAGCSGQPKCGNLTAHCAPRTAYSQGGWLMPVAAFIIVVMGLLAVGLSNIVSQANISAAQERITVQTFFAAESGAQYAMNQLFYDTANPITPAVADSNCVAINGDVVNFTAVGIDSCSTTLACTTVMDPGSGTSFYQVSSAAQCQIGNVSAMRTIDVSAYLQ